MSNTPWIKEGPLAARFRTEGDLLIKETEDMGEQFILEENKRLANEVTQGNKPRDLSFGRYLGSVPMLTLLKWQKTHPDLFSPDAETARKALIKFWNSTEGRPYRVQKA